MMDGSILTLILPNHVTGQNIFLLYYGWVDVTLITLHNWVKRALWETHLTMQWQPSINTLDRVATLKIITVKIGPLISLTWTFESPDFRTVFRLMIRFFVFELLNFSWGKVYDFEETRSLYNLYNYHGTISSKWWYKWLI